MTIRFYAACLASYNNGILHGCWIDASDDIDAMQSEVNAMLRASPVADAEEWAVHDHENLPRCFGEYPGLQKIADYIAFVDVCDELGIDADDCANVFDELDGPDHASNLRDRFCTIADSFRSYADEFADEQIACESSESILQRYFDYEAFARDLTYDYDIIESSSGSVIILRKY